VTARSAKRVRAIAFLSVRPSVRPSATTQLQIQAQVR